MRAALGKVVEHEPSAAALEQTLRDEDPKTHIVMLISRAANWTAF